MHHQTAWTKKASSLPSDRIAPRNAPKKPKQSANRSPAGSDVGGVVGVSKSKDVRRLETLRDGLQSLVSSGRTPGKDPKGGCFCQGMSIPSSDQLRAHEMRLPARSHTLSSYTPVCTNCGLPLCTLNLPIHACPSCRSALLSLPALQALLATVEKELQETLQREEDERRKKEQERQRIEGGFPTLESAGLSTNLAVQAAPPQAHKVLSLNSKTKRVVVSSYTEKPKRTPSSSQAGSRADSPVDLEASLPPRVPPPPSQVPLFTISANKLKDRPWANAREEVSYVGPARL